MIAQLSAWDTEQDALEFFNAYAKRTERRYKSASPLSTSAPNEQVAEKSWRTDEGNVIMQRRGTRVLVVEGIQPGKDAGALLSKLWQ